MVHKSPVQLGYVETVNRSGEFRLDKKEKQRSLPVIWNLTLANRRLNVSSKATLTFQLNRSPNIRISGPVMLTTEGFRASAEVSLITSPKAFAASSFCSGLPVRTPSRSTGRIEVTPCHRNQTRKQEPTMQTTPNLLSPNFPLEVQAWKYLIHFLLIFTSIRSTFAQFDFMQLCLSKLLSA